MGSKQYQAILKKGATKWNAWRTKYLKAFTESWSGKRYRFVINEANFKKVDLINVNFSRASLYNCNFGESNLNDGNFDEAEIGYCSFKRANLSYVSFNEAGLYECNFFSCNFFRADFNEAEINESSFRKANFSEARLVNADLINSIFTKACFTKADLTNARLGFDLRGADFRYAKLISANLAGAWLQGADLRGADLSYAYLINADLSGADLSGANLSHARLDGAKLIRTNLTDCRIYGTSAWDLTLTNAIQSNLIITPQYSKTMITMDNLEVAQFIYLLLDSKKIRDVIDTIAKKAVLLLGRFTPERKAVLESIRDILRQKGYLPILFDFDKPQSRDLTETISTLAHLSRFIIVDLTSPSSGCHTECCVTVQSRKARKPGLDWV
jgi:uncharacterized protein YjbI with pentapeptide repeats